MAQFGGGRERGALARDVVVAVEKENLGVVRLAQADHVPMCQHVFRRTDPVNERAELRLGIAQPAHAIDHGNFGVVSGYPDADHSNVALRAAAERDERLVYGDPPSAVRVGDDQTRVPVAHVVLVLSTLIHRPWQSAREAEADIVQ